MKKLLNLKKQKTMKKLSMIVWLIFSFAFCNLDIYAQFNRANNKSGVAYRSNYQRMAAGRFHTIEIRNGTLWSWGYNGMGQLGDGTQTDKINPVQVGIDNKWVIVATSSMHSLGIKSDGTLWAWGSNSIGQLGDGTVTLRTSPVQIGTDNKWVSVAAGTDYTIALKSDGTLWAWGSNQNGQLGNGVLNYTYIPVQLGTDTKWVSITTGDAHSIALKSDGTLWSWGRNTNGQLGNGTTSQSTSPVQVGTETKWTGISACGDHSLALKSDGTTWSWGLNTNGQIGDGTTTNRTSPVQVGSDIKWVSIAAAVSHSVALKSDGTAWAWGFNSSGQLGDGTTTQRVSPVQIGSENNWVSVDAFQYHTLGLKSNGTLWAWGNNDDGELGDGTTTTRYNPVQVSSDNKWLALSTGGDHTAAIKSDGSLWTCGFNALGQLGDGTTTNRSNPVQIGDNKWISIEIGQTHTAGLKSDGTLWAWGWNADGQLGDGTTVNKHSPVQIGSDNKWVHISAGDYHTCGLKSDGTLWAWGDNGTGELGDGTTTDKTSPVQIGSDNKWVSVAAGGGQTLALKSDGTLWVWGWNAYGQVGDGTTTNRTSPLQIGTDTKWVRVAAGYYHSLAMKSDGTIWAWGGNSFGQIGDGTNTTRTSPLQIGSDNKWVSIEAGTYLSSGLKSDGSLWLWGYNNYGQIGNGTTANQLSPVQIPGQANVIMTKPGGSHSAIIKSDRAQICMTGYNAQGQLGNGTTTDRNTFECVVGTPAAVTSGVISPLSFCGGASVSIPVNVTGSFNAGNTFTAQLSDANGSFASPTNIGTLSATGAGTINGTIPSNISAGTSYRIRVTASNPVINGGDNGSNITLNPGVAASVSISANPAGAICYGTSVTFTAVGVNGGAGPFYLWKRNGFNAGNGLTYTSSTLNNNDNIVCEMTSNAVCVTGSPATSNAITMTVNQPGEPYVTIYTTNNGTICSGSPLTIYATPYFGGANPSFQWQVNGVNAGTNSSSFTTSTLATNDHIRCILTSSEPCAYNNPDTSADMVMQWIEPTYTPSVTISTNTTTICSGTSVTITATPANYGSYPTYQWFKNGVFAGGNSPFFTSSSLANNDYIECVMHGSAICISGNPATSNTTTMTVNPNVSASVSISANPAGAVCPGTNVMFTAAPVNGGSVPAYQWKVNGGNTGTNSSTFSSSSLNHNDVVSCQLTSTQTCANPPVVNSNNITMNINAVTTSVSISSNTGTTICQGTNVIFTATPVNGGTSPSYQWKVNGVNAGTNSDTFSSSTLTDGDAVTCELTSSETCVTSATALSNNITMNVTSPLTPAISISSGMGPEICQGTSTTFTATVTAGGSTPSYQWKINGMNVGTNSDHFTPSILNDGDVVSCELTSSETCVTSSTVLSYSITMTVYSLPVVTATDVSGCTGTSISLSATPAGGTYSVANPYTGATTTYTYTYTDDNGCTNTSAPANITVNPLPVVSFTGLAAGYSVSAPSVTLTGNPAGGTFSGPGISGNTFSPSSAGAGGPYTIVYSYTNTNGCSNTSSQQTTVTNCAVPTQPGTISVSGGIAKVCPGDTRIYTTAAATGVTFSWTVPAGATINSGQGTRSINVTYGAGFTASGTITVVKVNGCGSGPARTLSVNRNNPAAPGVITGQDNGLCNLTGVPYSIVNVAGMNYNWSFNSTGASVISGQGTNAITANYNPPFLSGKLSVTAANACGTSPARTLAVKVTPATPVSITGATSVCANQQGVPYSTAPLASAVSYTWIGPPGSHISDGITTSPGVTLTTTSNSVTVNFGNTTGKLNVRGNNACGNGLYKFIVVGFNCREGEEQEAAGSIQFAVYPNPTRGEITLEYNGVSAENYLMQVLDLSGRKVMEQEGSAAEGFNRVHADLSSIAKGVYVIEFKSGSINKKSRVVVE